MTCSNCFDAKGRKITRISVPHKEEYTEGKLKITEGVII